MPDLFPLFQKMFHHYKILGITLLPTSCSGCNPGRQQEKNKAKHWSFKSTAVTISVQKKTHLWDRTSQCTCIYCKSICIHGQYMHVLKLTVFCLQFVVFKIAVIKCSYSLEKTSRKKTKSCTSIQSKPDTEFLVQCLTRHKAEWHRSDPQ